MSGQATRGGDGRPTASWLLLHGTPLSPRVWDEVADRLTADEPAATVWTPPVVPVDGDPDPQRTLASGLAAAARASGRRWHVVGHSFGGQVAVDLAIAAPDVVASVTVACARADPFPAFVEHAARVRAGESVAESSVRRWFTADEVAADGVVVRAARAAVEGADPGVYATALAGIARFDRVAQAATITAPAVIVAAELDAGSPPSAMARLARAVRGAELAVIPAAAHMSPFVRTPEFVDLILRAAGRLGARP